MRGNPERYSAATRTSRRRNGVRRQTECHKILNSWPSTRRRTWDLQINSLAHKSHNSGEDLLQKHGYAALRAANGGVKNAILGGNGTRLYNVDPARLRSEAIHFDNDMFAKLKKLHEAQGIGPPNIAYGFVTR